MCPVGYAEPSGTYATEEGDGIPGLNQEKLRGPEDSVNKATNEEEDSIAKASRGAESVTHGLVPTPDHGSSPKDKKRAASKSDHEAQEEAQKQKK
jgi:hypothetical protein